LLHATLAAEQQNFILPFAPSLSGFGLDADRLFRRGSGKLNLSPTIRRDQQQT
jgi:hypothetical protein